MPEQLDVCVVEAGGQTVGIVIRHRRGYLFYGSDRRVAAMEGSLYRSPAEAERAATLVLQQSEAEETAARRRSPIRA